MTIQQRMSWPVIHFDPPLPELDKSMKPYDTLTKVVSELRVLSELYLASECNSYYIGMAMGEFADIIHSATEEWKQTTAVANKDGS